MSQESPTADETLVDPTKRDAIKLLGVGASLAAFGTGTASADGGETRFEFRSMVGNTLTGADGAIRGVNAGGLPWVVDEAEVKFEEGGRLKAEVEGLVLADDPSVPESLRGTNPVPAFRAIASCLTLTDGMHQVANVQTDTAPATSGGDWEIEEMISLPEPCLAPIVFVTHPNGAWFAVTGV